MTSTHTPHAARTTTPIVFTDGDGHVHTVPPGPCLIEPIDDDRVLVVWDETGERSASMSVIEAERAQQDGSLVLLD
ncbi:MAG: hypothetical protein ABI702_13690 [Burkholderiales bacterium]